MWTLHRQLGRGAFPDQSIGRAQTKNLHVGTFTKEFGANADLSSHEAGQPIWKKYADKLKETPPPTPPFMSQTFYAIASFQKAMLIAATKKLSAA